MIEIVPMTEAHVRALEPQPAQAFESLEERVDSAREYAAAGPCWAVLGPDGVLCVASVVQAWPGRGIAWALLSAKAGPHMVALTRAVRAYLDSLAFKRIEMCVAADHAPGCRWAEMLGFNCETPEPMVHFTPHGGSAYLYGRIKP